MASIVNSIASSVFENQNSQLPETSYQGNHKEISIASIDATFGNAAVRAGPSSEVQFSTEGPELPLHESPESSSSQTTTQGGRKRSHSEFIEDEYASGQGPVIVDSPQQDSDGEAHQVQHKMHDGPETIIGDASSTQGLPKSASAESANQSYASNLSHARRGNAFASGSGFNHLIREAEAPVAAALLSEDIQSEHRGSEDQSSPRVSDDLPISTILNPVSPPQARHPELSPPRRPISNSFMYRTCEALAPIDPSRQSIHEDLSTIQQLPPITAVFPENFAPPPSPSKIKPDHRFPAISSYLPKHIRNESNLQPNKTRFGYFQLHEEHLRRTYYPPNQPEAWSRPEALSRPQYHRLGPDFSRPPEIPDDPCREI